MYKPLPEFEYYRPRTLKEALELLDRYKEGAKILAGGTDLLVKMKKGLLKPRAIIDISLIDDLKFIGESDGSLVIGATTTLSDVESSDLVRKKAPVLAEAVAEMGSLQVRNRGTIGGNLCNASPAADTAPPLLVLDAQCEIMSSKERRLIHIQDFFVGPGLTILKPEEMLTRIFVPIPPTKRGMSFIKLGRRNAFTLSVVSAACAVKVNETGEIEDVKLALGAVAPTPIRVREVEEKLKGIRITEKASIEKVLESVKDIVKPISDVRASATYRREMSYVIARRSLEMAIKRCLDRS
jgi:carbon-monoxide dehydrogenase medium subunit